MILWDSLTKTHKIKAVVPSTAPYIEEYFIAIALSEQTAYIQLSPFQKNDINAIKGLSLLQYTFCTVR